MKWKIIKDNPNYSVSDTGLIKRNQNNYLLKPSKARGGYKKVALYKNGKPKNFLIHRLVAQAFIPNPNNCPQVNHIDENKVNNKVSNLEWCTAKYNDNYGSRNKRMKENTKNNIHKSKAVIQFDLNGKFIKRWASTRECGRHGFNQSAVAACCRHEYSQHHNFKWQYESEVI